MNLSPKNWTAFQHYKNRRPPWIKLHHGLLDDYEFSRLPVASRALAPMLWLLASEYAEGTITASADEIAFRLHMTTEEFSDAIQPLVNKGFFIDASNMLASRKQDALLEKRRGREVEIEEERELDDKRLARAREPLISPEAHAISDAFLGSIGFTDHQAIPPEWFGVPHRAQVWHVAGWQLPMIVATAKRVMEGRGSPPSVKYFEKAFANAFASQNAPAPTGRPTERHQNGQDRSVGAAAGRLIEQGFKLSPRPGSVAYEQQKHELRARDGVGSLHSAEGPNNVRLLPKG